ncbi:MAG: GDP-mannose 4,6-dehydratase, partial [Candidatus Muiribacteriota bacterium]
MSNNSKLYKASDSNFNSKFDISQSKLNKNSDSNSTLDIPQSKLNKNSDSNSTFDIPQSKLLIIGLDSFTGLHFSNYIEGKFEIFGTVFNPDFFLQRENIENYKNKYENKIFKCDITKKDEIKNILTKINPDFIIHLAGLSFVNLKNSLPFYNVNVIGIQNLLESIAELNQKPEKIILPSSATVYGKNAIGVVSEKVIPE